MNKKILVILAGMTLVVVAAVKWAETYTIDERVEGYEPDYGQDH